MTPSDTPITDAFYTGPCNDLVSKRCRAHARELERAKDVEIARFRAEVEELERSKETT